MTVFIYWQVLTFGSVFKTLISNMKATWKKEEVFWEALLVIKVFLKFKGRFPPKSPEYSKLNEFILGAYYNLLIDFYYAT